MMFDNILVWYVFFRRSICHSRYKRSWKNKWDIGIEFCLIRFMTSIWLFPTSLRYCVTHKPVAKNNAESTVKCVLYSSYIAYTPLHPLYKWLKPVFFFFLSDSSCRNDNPPFTFLTRTSVLPNKSLVIIHIIKPHATCWLDGIQYCKCIL